MSKPNTMTRDELFARVEVLKLARDVIAPTISGEELVKQFDVLWTRVLPEGRELDCGCGGSKSSAKPETQTFTGTHVVPFSWVRDAAGTTFTMWVMDAPLYVLTIDKEAQQAVLVRDGFEPQTFSGKDAGQQGMQAANDGAVAWLNANAEMVREWIASKRATPA
jgi:hypothetical protein